MEQLLTVLRGQGHGTYEQIIIPVWFGLMVVSFAVWKASSPATRQRLLPIGSVIAGAIMLSFFYVMTRGTKDESWPFFISVVAVVGFIIYSSGWLMRVCQGCGTANRPLKLLSPSSFCKKCGARLDA